MSEELKPCPFCGASASIVQTGAASTPRKPGRLCVITCDNGCFEFNSDELADDQGKAWNTRAELSAIKGGGEAVAWMHSRSGAVATAATKSTMEDGSIPSGYDVPLYTHPPVVAEAEATVCMGCVDLSSHVRELEHKMDYYKALNATPASGAVPADNFQRAAELLRKMPGWKRDFQLTASTALSAENQRVVPVEPLLAEKHPLDAVPVRRELLERLVENLRGTSIDRPFPTGTYKLLTELRALLAKGVES